MCVIFTARDPAGFMVPFTRYKNLPKSDECVPPYADSNPNTKSWKTAILQKCATLLAKEPIFTFGSFPDFETDDSESMHTIFADVQRFDNVLQVLNDIDGYLVSILCKLFTARPTCAGP